MRGFWTTDGLELSPVKRRQGGRRVYSYPRLDDSRSDQSYMDFDTDDSYEVNSSAFFESSPILERNKSRHRPRSPSRFELASDPIDVLGYIKVLVNIFTCSLVLIVVYKFWNTLRHDLSVRAEHARAVLVAEINECRRLYDLNQCASSKLPATMAVCAEWQRCMNRDPQLISHAQLSAEGLGEMMESFLAPLGARVRIILVLVIPATLLLVNFSDPRMRQRQAIPPQPQFIYQTPVIVRSPSRRIHRY